MEHSGPLSHIWRKKAVMTLPEQMLIKQKTPLLLGPVETNGLSLALACLASQQASSSPQSQRRLWITSANARHREQLINELSFWGISSISLIQAAPTSFEEALPDPDLSARFISSLLRILEDQKKDIRVIFTDVETFHTSAPQPNELRAITRTLRVGEFLDPSELIQQCLNAGFQHVSSVAARGQFAQRGSIIDLFGFHGRHPLRIEFFDTSIESLRFIDLDTQGSIKRIREAPLLLSLEDFSSPLSNWKEANDLFINWSWADDLPMQSEEQNKYKSSALNKQDPSVVDITLSDDPSLQSNDQHSFPLLAPPFFSLQAGDFILAEHQQDTLFKQIKEWQENQWDIGIISHSHGEWARFLELAQEHDCSLDSVNQITTTPNCSLHRSLLLPKSSLVLLSLHEIFGRSHPPQSTTDSSNLLDQQRLSLLQRRQQVNNWEEGDLIVHRDYGIGQYLGLNRDSTEEEEHLSIQYAHGVSLNVPIHQSHLLTRYIGMGQASPNLQVLGSTKWNKAKELTQDATLEYAAQLLSLQAKRNSETGISHPPDSQWMREFEEAFPYTETLDQATAIRDTKTDLESSTPMDRLICGDVGFGKTEVAIRAAFKVITGGHQVAMLVPTTVLAEQHYQTFCERMSHFPINIQLLSRFQSATESKNILNDLAQGSIDLIIGTHRLLSPRLIIPKIGLIIIDEEQRFGVKHKEAFKTRFHNIDILTLSATPIPRTLYLSLMGARDMSTIDTPPPNRHPVHTAVCSYEPGLIQSAIRRELKRGGQIFFLHNRVSTIEQTKTMIQALVPEVRILIGHGQMHQQTLEETMHAFIAGQADVLLATSIIESGIDIPNANTIIIDRADRFGLSDLYQLRGRVGRSGVQAYAILLLPQDLLTTGAARKRLNAIHQYTALGSGFKIAMRDLEIRGAGNLLGTKQSGHIASVGFDLYCQLLKQAIEQLKAPNQPLSIGSNDIPFRASFVSSSEEDYQKRLQAKENALLPCFIPSSYISEPSERIIAYRELAITLHDRELTLLSEHWQDRYGPLPKPVSNLLLIRQIRIVAQRNHLESIELKNSRLMLKRNGHYITLEENQFPRLKQTQAHKQLLEALHYLKSM